MANHRGRRAQEEALLTDLGSQGTAALGLLRNILKALRAKGIFTDIEILAICDATVEQARGSTDPASERYAESVREAIHRLQDSVLGPSAGEQKH